MTKPLTPAQAKQKKIEEIPDLVIRAVNSLLRGDYVTFNISKLKKAIMAEVEAGKEEYPSEESRPWYYNIKEIPKEWYDFEPIFRKAGWSVDCDIPAYNESYETNWTFRAK